MSMKKFLIGFATFAVVGTNFCSAATFLTAQDFYSLKQAYGKEVQPDSRWTSLKSVRNGERLNWRWFMLRDSQCQKTDRSRRCRLYSGLVD
jgi:hypothetical protein